MPNYTVTSPGPPLVATPKLVSGIALMFYLFVGNIWSLSLLHFIYFHL